MKPPLAQGCFYFVGRQQDISRIDALLSRDGTVFLEDTQGEEGLGKTTFLAYFYKLLKEKDNYHLCWLSMADFNFFETRAVGGGSEERCVLVNDFEKYLSILKALAKDLPSDYFGDFTEWIDSLSAEVLTQLLNRQLKVDMKGLTIKTGDVNVRWSNVKNADMKSGDVVVKIPDKEVQLAILTAKGRVNTEFSRRINLCERNKKVVILIDDFCKVLNNSQDLVSWLLVELIPQWQNSLVIVSRQASCQGLPANLNRIDSFRLKSFTSEEVSSYIAKRLHPAVVSKGLAERVYQFSGGHPQAVSLALDLVLQYGLDKENLLNIFDGLSTAVSGQFDLSQLRVLVKRIHASIPDEVVRQALEVGSLLRNFDAKVLRHMLSEGQNEAEDQDKQSEGIITKLKNYSFTQHYSDEQQQLEYYRFHEFIRREMNEQLKINDPLRQEKLHQKAAAYYSQLLTEYEQNQRDATEYLRWYRYENPIWQHMISEWLYHQSYITQRLEAHISFALTYFEAFWWWGCYLKFPFCERLILDWERTQIAASDREWVDLINKFHESYPTGYDKRGKGDWLQVEMALHRIRYLGKLGIDADFKLDDKRLRLRAITGLFLAHSRRYSKIEDSKADVYYEDAFNIFIEIDDNWNMNWVMYELADLYMERKQGNIALDLSKEALFFAFNSGENDYEVIANIYRVRADIYWDAGDFQQAFRYYSLALFYAYVFQARPFQADFYTQAFYNEMLGRSTFRLRGLWLGGNKEAALNFCRQLHDFWKPYWERFSQYGYKDDFSCEHLFDEQKQNDLIAYLAPAGPAAENVMYKNSGYAAQVELVISEMSEVIKAEMEFL